MDDNILDKLISRLTSPYNAKKGKHIHKLMQLTAKDIQDNEDNYLKIDEWRDIDKARGVVLDRAGGNVGQLRGQVSDEVYRVLIKSKIKRSMSDGSINTIIDFLSVLLQIPPSDVDISELWQEGRHATIHVNVPGGSVNQTGLSYGQFGKLINLVVAAGVNAEVLAAGTFAFSSNYTTGQIDANTGFDRGTLGYAYDPAIESDLPI